MTSNKAKVTPASPIRRLRDELLFARHFHYTSDLTPEDIQASLSGLVHQPNGLTRVFFPRQRFVDIIEGIDNTRNFTIKTKVGGLYTELTTTGTIIYDPSTSQTIVTGQVKFDPIYLAVLLTGLFVLITWGLASLSRAGISASPFILFTLGLTNLFYFRQMFRDRDELLTKLSEALIVDDIAQARNRLADTTIEHETTVITASESRQSQETSS